MDYSEFFNVSPYGLNKKDKDKLLTDKLLELTSYHIDNCSEYRNILNALNFDINSVKHYEDIPFLPVSLFKTMDILSIDSENIFKTMTSSGTSGQMVSKIFLDKQTANLQQKVLAKIVSEFTKTRLPMIIIDSPNVIKNREMFSARGAGILGFSMFGKDKIFALNDDMSINYNELLPFLEKHKNEDIFLFGFTFMIWQHFYKQILKDKKNIDLTRGILIHGGGWKKLESEKISSSEFKHKLNELTNINQVYDYYGMVEQTGCIYMECEEGHLHSSIFSDVIIRNYKDFSVCELGEKGIVSVVSVIPYSYAGHSLLTEDEGVILGVDNCKCGRLGKYFEIFGRVKNAEIRGCSDTYAKDFE